MRCPPTLHPLLLLTIIFLLVYTHCQPPTLTSTVRQSAVYVVKFFKATSSELEARDSNKKIHSEIQFLEKLVRNTPDVLSQAVFYVNFTIQVPSANFSNIIQNKNNNINSNPIPTISTPSLPKILPDKNTSSPNKVLNDSTSPDNQNASSVVLNTNTSKSIGPESSGNTTRPPPNKDVLLVNENTFSAGSSRPQTNNTPTFRPARNTTTPLPLSNFTTPPITPLSIYKSIPSATTTRTTTSNSLTRKPIPSKQPLNTEFPGVALYHPIATDFVQNETYRFAGVITNPALLFDDNSTMSSFTFVNVIFGGVESDDKIKCIEKVTKKKLEFQISCQLKMAGVFYLSIFIGGSGYSSRELRRIYEAPRSLPALPDTPPKPESLFLTIIQGDLFLNWYTASPLTKVSFRQGNNHYIELILSNNHTRFRVPHYQFLNFDEDVVTVTISHAASRDNTLYGISSLFGDMLSLDFQATQHLHVNNQEDIYTFVPEIPAQVQANQDFTLTGKFSLVAQNQYYLVNPYNQIKKFLLDPKLKASNNNSMTVIEPGTSFTLRLNFPVQGPNLLQINQDSGLAIINQPIYVGDIYPLIPDYVDLKIQSLLDRVDTTSVLQAYVRSTYPRQINIKQPSEKSTIEQKRNYMLNLLNMLRTREIVNPVYLDDRLNIIAQDHSNDMAQNNFFSHTNLNNEGPGQRARKFGFSGAIGENVAQSSSLIEAHLSLQRSAAHFENSISKIWTRVGIGINQTAFGQYLVTFEFSSRDITLQPLTKAQLETHQAQLIEMIKRKFPSIKQQYPQISSIILQWMQSNRVIPLMQYIITKGIKQLMINNSIKFTYYPQFVTEIENTGNIFGNVARYNHVGVNCGISRIDPTLMECYFVFLLVGV